MLMLYSPMLLLLLVLGLTGAFDLLRRAFTGLSGKLRLLLARFRPQPARVPVRPTNEPIILRHGEGYVR